PTSPPVPYTTLFRSPVCHVAPFDSEEQAVQLANDTRYGLAAAVWTSNLQRAHRVARQLEVGIAWVNDWYLRDLRTPFGGVKLSRSEEHTSELQSPYD